MTTTSSAELEQELRSLRLLDVDGHVLDHDGHVLDLEDRPAEELELPSRPR